MGEVRLVASKRTELMSQASFWTVDMAGPPGKLGRPTMASSQTGGMLTFLMIPASISGMSAMMPIGPARPLAGVSRLCPHTVSIPQ